MKSIAFTDFRNKASDLITEVEHGETIIILRHGKPVAEVIPYSDKSRNSPAWKQPAVRLLLQGKELSSAILEEREATS